MTIPLPSITIRFRRNTAANWTAKNPILAAGEPAYERDTKKFKIGDGVTSWVDLEYFTPDFNSETPPEDMTGVEAAIWQHVNDTEPHPVYDDGPSLVLLYQNAKV